MHVHACVCVHMCTAYMYVRTRVHESMCVCASMCVCVCAQVCVHMCMRVCAGVHACMCTYALRASTCVSVCICACVCVYACVSQREAGGGETEGPLRTADACGSRHRGEEPSAPAQSPSCHQYTCINTQACDECCGCTSVTPFLP